MSILPLAHAHSSLKYAICTYIIAYCATIVFIKLVPYSSVHCESKVFYV